MSNPIEKAYNQLNKRAQAFETLANGITDKQTLRVLQSTYAGLKASAELIVELEDQVFSQIDKKLASAQGAASVAVYLDALLSFKIILDQYPGLLESGSLLSQGKDIAAIKHMGKEVLKSAVMVGATLSGGKLIKDVTELVKILEELASAGESFKFRKKQVQHAADFHQWAQATLIANIAWSCAAQRFLCDTSRQAAATNDDVLDRVEKRIVKCSQEWNPQ